MLSVHSDDSNWTKKAKEILERTGAEDISSTGEARADFAKSDKPIPRALQRQSDEYLLALCTVHLKSDP